MGEFRLPWLFSAACLLVIFMSGCGSGDEAGAEQHAAIAKYRSYLNENAGSLTTWVRELNDQIANEELGGAQFSYAMARVQYSQIEPEAQMFRKLDASLNSQADEVAAGDFGGFHRIEKALFAEETTDGIGRAAARLRTDVAALRHKLRARRLRAVQIMVATRAALEELTHSKLDGDEERYAHIDLVDIAANVEGVEAAFKAVIPILNENHPQAVAQVKSDLDDVYASLRPLGSAAREVEKDDPESAGIKFDIYNELPPGFKPAVVKRVNALTNAFTEMAVSSTTSQ
jgi:iron uptake system EfeUOB component EfeO/EfeM